MPLYPSLPKGKPHSLHCILLLIPPLMLMLFLPFFPALVFPSVLEEPFCIPPAAPPAVPLQMTKLGHSRTLFSHPSYLGRAGLGAITLPVIWIWP